MKHKNYRHIILSVFMLCPGLLLAQVDTTATQEEIDTNIEDFITSTEIEEQVDLSFITDFLEELTVKPLNLNSATQEELLKLPGINLILANNLAQHIEQYGKLNSIYELQAVKGFNPGVLQQIIPYCKVQEAGPNDISPGVKHPAGPSLGEVFGNLRTEFIQRMVFVIEERKGYTPADTLGLLPILNESGDSIGVAPRLSSRYLGSPYRHYSRLRLRYGNNFSFALVGENDPGEQFKWDPKNNFYGYDYVSAHIGIHNFGAIKDLVVGDYTLQFGQGLALSRGLGFGKGSEVINNVKMPETGIRPYASVNENLFQRGAASTIAFGDLHITGFYSKVRLDGNVSSPADTLDDFPEASGIQLSGLHRTASELENRQGIEETFYGGRVAIKTRTLKVGGTFYRQSFNTSLNPSLNFFNQFAFRGNENYISSFDFDWVFQNFNFFGELARSKSGGIGMTGGFMSSLSPTLDLAVVARKFDIDFHSLKGYAFAERPTTLANEAGLYIGVKLKLNPKWTINTYFDQYFFPWNKFRTSYPSRGYEFLTRIEYKPRRSTQLYVQYRSDNRQENSRDISDGQKLDYLSNIKRDFFRFHFQSTIDRILTVRNRIEFSFYDRDDASAQRGFLAYQDISYKLGFKFKVTARYALFDAPDFNTRIYAYENDILGFFSIPPYYRKGSRYYAILNIKMSRNIEFWLRFAQTRFNQAYLKDSNGQFFLPASRGRSVNGSGLEEIIGNNRSEVKLQIRFKF